MMHNLDLRNASPGRAELLSLLPRAGSDVASVEDAARVLIDDVRQRGTAALLDQAERLDGVRPKRVAARPDEIANAVAALVPSVRDALEAAIERVRIVTHAQVPTTTATTVAPGALVTQRWVPMDRVGLYVPGGNAVYPSSVVMNVVPAQVAGVGSIAIASPAQKRFNGSVHPTILGAAGLLGIEEIYAMGGAGAIGAFAYGVPDLGLEPVDMVTGPGNVYVAAAKRVVRGVCGIDSEAGPTEILVIADSTADPRLVAADLVSQAEHDELAAAILVTDSADFAGRVLAELELIVAATPHGARVRRALTGSQSAIVLVSDLGVAVNFSNVYGPEHLEVQVADPHALLDSIHNAGAVFIGENSPVSLGDYLAGSNHVLPTGGHSRFSSGLGAHTFLRPQQVVNYDREALATVRDQIIALSDAENLPAHAAAVVARFE